MEASNNNNSVFPKLEEDAIWKASHSCAPTVPVDDRELQWVFRD